MRTTQEQLDTLEFLADWWEWMADNSIAQRMIMCLATFLAIFLAKHFAAKAREKCRSLEWQVKIQEGQDHGRNA